MIVMMVVGCSAGRSALVLSDGTNALSQDAKRMHLGCLMPDGMYFHKNAYFYSVSPSAEHF